MANKTVSREETVAFVAKLLKADPEIAFSDVKKKAKAAGFHVYPLIAGLARKSLGWAPSVKAKAAKKSKAAAPAAAGAAPKRRGRPPGSKNKPRAAAATTTIGAGDLGGALAALQNEFAAMRDALAQIASIASRF
jgi:hypothetical protein